MSDWLAILLVAAGFALLAALLRGCHALMPAATGARGTSVDAHVRLPTDRNWLPGAGDAP